MHRKGKGRDSPLVVGGISAPGSVCSFCCKCVYCTTQSVDVSALKIHMSKNAHYALEAFPEYVTESRGDIFIKVKITLRYLRNQFFSSILEGSVDRF